MSKFLSICKQTTKLLLIITLVACYLVTYVLMILVVTFLSMFTAKYSFWNQMKDILTLNPKPAFTELIRNQLKPINKTFLLLLDLIKKW